VGGRESGGRRGLEREGEVRINEGEGDLCKNLRGGAGGMRPRSSKMEPDQRVTRGASWGELGQGGK